MGEKIRAFIYIDFPERVKKEIAKIQQMIQNEIKFTGKLTELKNLHLTLKSIGENKKRKNIRKILQK